MNIDIFLISFFTYLLLPVVIIAKGKKATNMKKSENYTERLDDK